MNEILIKQVQRHLPREVQSADSDRVAAGAYHAPRITVLGSLAQVQAYYTGTYWDGPNSWLYYN